MGEGLSHAIEAGHTIPIKYERSVNLPPEEPVEAKASEEAVREREPLTSKILSLAEPLVGRIAQAWDKPNDEFSLHAQSLKDEIARIRVEAEDNRDYQNLLLKESVHLKSFGGSVNEFVVQLNRKENESEIYKERINGQQDIVSRLEQELEAYDDPTRGGDEVKY